jgi:hypothetical protein
VRYFVVTQDGQRFGPADVNTLQQWANEGRLLATTTLEEEISGNRVLAGSVPGLNLGGGTAAPYGYPTQAPTQQTPTPQSPYGQPQSPYGQGPNPYNPPQGENNPYAQNPYAQGGNYYRGAGGHPAYDPDLQREMTNAWIGGALGLACCGPLAIWGLMCANKAKAGGHPSASGAVALNIIALVLWGIGILLNGIGVLSMF